MDPSTAWVVVPETVEHRVPQRTVSADHRRLAEREPDVFRYQPADVEVGDVEILSRAHTFACLRFREDMLAIPRGKGLVVVCSTTTKPRRAPLGTALPTKDQFSRAVDSMNVSAFPTDRQTTIVSGFGEILSADTPLVWNTSCGQRVHVDIKKVGKSPDGAARVLRGAVPNRPNDPSDGSPERRSLFHVFTREARPCYKCRHYRSRLCLPGNPRQLASEAPAQNGPIYIPSRGFDEIRLRRRSGGSHDLIWAICPQEFVRFW